MPTLDRHMTRNVVTISPNATAQEAARAMASNRIGSLLVSDGPRFVGLLTETDIVRKVVGEGKDPAKTPVSSIVGGSLESIESTRSLSDASDRMRSSGVRYLAVTSGGNVVGLLSIRDLLVSFQEMSEPKVGID
jgi:CBS domain-containing protein